MGSIASKIARKIKPRSKKTPPKSQKHVKGIKR